jgi:hypothetical protein
MESKEIISIIIEVQLQNLQRSVLSILHFMNLLVIHFKITYAKGSKILLFHKVFHPEF